MKQKIVEAWGIAKHAPLRVKLVLVFLVIYLLSPIDLIPDFIPVLGQLDDILIFGLVMGYVCKYVPEMREVFPRWKKQKMDHEPDRDPALVRSEMAEKSVAFD